MGRLARGPLGFCGCADGVGCWEGVGSGLAAKLGPSAGVGAARAAF